MIVNVQRDEPLIPGSLILQLTSFAEINVDFDISTAITPLKNINDVSNPNVVKVALGGQGRAVIFQEQSFHMTVMIETFLMDYLGMGAFLLTQ